MKICFLLMWADDAGGTNRAVYTQANGLRLRHTVQILSVARRTNSRFYDLAADIPVQHLVDETHTPPAAHSTPARESGDLAAQPSREIHSDIEPGFSRLTDVEIERALGQLDADVLITTTPPLLRLATKFAPAGVAVVHQEHRTSETRNDDIRQMLVDAARSAAAVVVLTERTAAWFRAVLGESKTRVAVIPNALADEYRPLSRGDTKTVVTASRLVRAKQNHHLIDAFRLVVADRTDWKLRIFGDGPQYDALRRRVRRSHLSDNVEVMGLTPHMAREWGKASIGVLASRREGFPLVITEAMAAGVPFVSYDSPNGPAAIITSGVDGLITPLDDVEALAGGLLRLINDDDERRRMAAAALATANRFRSGPIVEQWDALYREVAAP